MELRVLGRGRVIAASEMSSDSRSLEFLLRSLELERFVEDKTLRSMNFLVRFFTDQGIGLSEFQIIL